MVTKTMLPPEKHDSQLGFSDLPCSLCQSSESRLLLSQRDLLTGGPGTFTLVECLHCGLIRQNPRLQWDSLKSYYGGGYNPYETLIESEPVRLQRLGRRYGMWKRLKHIERRVSGGKLLDVGCGTGIFLAEAHRRPQWETVGLEPNEFAASYVEEHLGITIIHSRLEDASLPDGSFDVITMWNVLEHLEEPVDCLERAHRLLREGGLLVMSIPNLDSWEAGLFGRYWIGWDQPRHLHLFSRRTLAQVLEALGFRVIGQDCIAAAHAAFGQSIEIWLRSTFPQSSALRTFVPRVYNSFPFRLLTSPFFFVSDRLGASTLLTVSAQRL